MASPMHDIGKIAIPDNILNKLEKFEPHEWETMKTHAEIGYEMLKYSQRPILKAAAIIANQQQSLMFSMHLVALEFTKKHGN